MKKSLNTLAAVATALAAVGLAACDSRKDGETVGQKVDQAIASAKTATEEAKQNASRGAERAAEASKEKTDDVAKVVSDVAITASVKTNLAKDPELSALRINVDTKNGHVSLYGSAPNEAARQRAQTIAMAANGVTGVDNKLAIESR
jgi:hyperosmotically inducible periplasmic protein